MDKETVAKILARVPSLQVFLKLDRRKRIGIVVGFLLLVLASLPGKKQPKPEELLENAFPSGPAGLVDSNVEADRARALAASMQKERDENIEPAEPEPDTKQKPAADLPEADRAPDSIGPFAALPKQIDRPIETVNAADGSLLVLQRSGILQFSKDSYATPRIILDSDLYDREFNEDMPALTSMAQTKDGKIWAGFMNGELMRYSRFEWKILSMPMETLSRHVSGIIEAKNGDVFVGSKGLYKWDAGFKRLLGDEDFKDTLITAFAVSKKGELYAGAPTGLWKYNDDEHKWSRIWKTPKQDSTIYAIFADLENELLLGTQRGLVRISSKGVTIDRLMPGEQVLSIVQAPDKSFWAGSARGGLSHLVGDQWFKAGASEGIDKPVLNLHIDPDNVLWMSVDHRGVYYAPLTEAATWISSYTAEQESNDQPQVLGDACEAARKLLTGINVSRDVAYEIIDGTDYVFFNGRLVCPKSVGFRRADGAVLLLNDWVLRFFQDQERKEVPIPRDIPADKSKIVLLDSKDRAWFAVEGGGLYMSAGEELTLFGEEQSLANIQDMLEDSKGNMWFATTPRYDESAKRYIGPNLHLYNDKGWFHYSPKQGIIFHLAYSLALKKDDLLVVGTNAGLSLIAQNADITNYGKDQGLERRFVHSLNIDGDDRIWFGHQFFGDGLTVFDGTVFTHFDASTGLFNDKITRIAHDRLKRVWVLASNGTVGIYPASFFEEKGIKQPLNTRRVRTRNMMEIEER